MSKRTDRRAAERADHKLAYQQSHQAETGSSPVIQPQPQTISEAQLAANRANAQHSTGAITPEGKAKSSMNALKHGLTGKTVLLPTDDTDEYDHKLQVYIAAFQPDTEEELALVQSLVDSTWRITRIKTLETGIMLKGQIEFASRYDDQPPERRAQLIDVETYLKYEKSIRNLNIQEARLQRQMEKEKVELTRLQANRKREEMFAALAKPASARPSYPASPAKPNGFEFSTPESQSQAPPQQAQTGR